MNKIICRKKLAGKDKKHAEALDSDIIGVLCECYVEMKGCRVPLSFFEGKKLHISKADWYKICVEENVDQLILASAPHDAAPTQRRNTMNGFTAPTRNNNESDTEYSERVAAAAMAFAQGQMAAAKVASDAAAKEKTLTDKAREKFQEHKGIVSLIAGVALGSFVTSWATTRNQVVVHAGPQ